jgi:RNA polymerase sigma-70 factor (ECF subfamily)
MGHMTAQVTTSDDELFDAWAAGCRASGARLIERHFDLVRRFFRNKVGPELEDLVQQTFLGCLEARERFERRATFKTFLLGISRNQLLLHYRRSRHATVDFSTTSIYDLGTSPSGAVARSQDEQLLAEAFRRVPLDAQLILELAYWEDLDGASIAQVLDVPINTAYSRLRRARDALRELLETIAPDRPALKGTFDKLDSLVHFDEPFEA